MARCAGVAGGLHATVSTRGSVRHRSGDTRVPVLSLDGRQRKHEGAERNEVARRILVVEFHTEKYVEPTRSYYFQRSIFGATTGAIVVAINEHDKGTSPIPREGLKP